MKKLADLTDPAAVRAAMVEFNDLGRDPFLAKYGFKPAKRYFLLHKGQRYDSKAIVAAAVGIQFPADGPLRAEDFSGGEATVRTRLQRLGFEVEVLEAAKRNPDWTREETILALDLLVRRRPTLPVQSDKEIVELSALLLRYAAQRGASGNDRFRNPDGVSMKVSNLSRLDPVDERGGLPHGSKTIEPLVWAEFMPDTAKLHAAAEAIRAQILAGALGPPEAVAPAAEAQDVAAAVSVSRGPRPSFGEVVHTSVDGETRVYLMRLVGRLAELFPSHNLHEKAVIKVGRTNDVKRRAEEMNGGFPPGLDLSWRPELSQTFANGDAAHDVEQALIQDLKRRGYAIGREFAIVPERLVDTLLVDAMASRRP